MKITNYQKFINKQKSYFNEHLQKTFDQTWSDTSWSGGIIGSGWLLSRGGKTYFNFTEIKNIKGLENLEIDPTYQEFIKAILVLSYQESNRKASPQKLKAEFLILKRWYSSLRLLLDTKSASYKVAHPTLLSTECIENAYLILEKNSSSVNLPDHIGTMLRIQKNINNYNFTKDFLEFNREAKYTNKQNSTPKAAKIRSAMASGSNIDEEQVDSSKLISIRTFINIISLTTLCESKGEKIILHLLLLLIITGFRSTEAILLKKDALLKKPILDPLTNEHLEIDGIKQFSLGIHYHGAKGSGIRIHWVEPLAAPLIEMIFNNVLELTKESRDHISYLRAKNVKDFLPKKIDDIDGDLVEIDQLIDTCFGVPDKTRGNIEKRDLIIKTLSTLPVFRKERHKQRINRYYLKSEINNFILSLNTYTKQDPIDHIFNYQGKKEKIPFEDLLFILPYRSSNLSRSLYNKTNITLVSNKNINSFLGADKNTSAFEKYKLYENESEFSSLTSHIPRHNINTFLALSGLSEHLQAMLMGRVDIKQNQYYQHLALNQMRVASSIHNKQYMSVINGFNENEIISPIEAIKKDGLIYTSEDLTLEQNIKNNLQTFDNKYDISNFIKGSFFDDYFKDLQETFDKLVEVNEDEADELLKRHSYLYPLPFGSCIRNVSLHSCPKRLSCQSGDKCGSFVLTGRRGELENIVLKRESLIKEYNIMYEMIKDDPNYREMLDSIGERIEVFTELETRSLNSRKKLIPIQVFNYDNTITRLPHTLSELFALEIEKKVDEKS